MTCLALYAPLYPLVPGSSDATPPSPPPAAQISISGDTVTVTQTSTAESGATRKLERRADGTTDAWTVVDTDAAPAIGGTLLDEDVPAGVYEYEVADYDAGGNRTFRGQRWTGVVIAASMWDAVLAVVRAQLVAQGIADADIYDGSKPLANYGEAATAWVLRPLTERVEERANGGLVLRAYPVEVELRVVGLESDDADKWSAVRAGQDILVSVFDGATPADLPSLPGLERATVEIASKSDTTRALDEVVDELRARARITFPIWETR
jgi:hypothetical protein